MGQLSAHFRHLDRMESGIAACRREFMQSGGLEGDRAVVERLTKSIVQEIADLAETITEEKVLGVIDEIILDEIGVCFMDAINKRDNRRSPESKAAAEADQRREMHNA